MRYLRCELHTHTVWSDGSMTPEELAANAAARGYDAIALTDHNTVFAYPRVRAAAEKLGRALNGRHFTGISPYSAAGARWTGGRWLPRP